METLILRGADIHSLVTMDEVLAVVEEAFRQKGLGGVQMPPKSYLHFDKYQGDLRTMPSSLSTPEIAAVKVVNSHPLNRQLDLPAVMAVLVLVQPATGVPLCVMDGTWLTAARTGAASAVATKHLARKDSHVLGMVGAGAQAVTQLIAISRVVDVREAIVYDVSREASGAFVERMSKEHRDIRFDAVGSTREAAEKCDVLVTVTPARGAIVGDEWIRPGTHINAVGADAPGKQELDPAILKRAKIVVDDREQTMHGGEINVPLRRGVLSAADIYGELGDIVAEKLPGRTSDDEITVFDSTGIAILDAATGHLAYRKALDANKGLRMELIS